MMAFRRMVPLSRKTTKYRRCIAVVGIVKTQFFNKSIINMQCCAIVKAYVDCGTQNAKQYFTNCPWLVAAV